MLCKISHKRTNRSLLEVRRITIMSKEIKFVDFWAAVNTVHCLSGGSLPFALKIEGLYILTEHFTDFCLSMV